jgi:aryl-alcohol dehydrogenase-like predicted oxidoreductase
MYTAQLAETMALLGPRLALYQVHSLTEDSPLPGDAALLDALGALRDTGVRVGLSTSGPAQAATLRRALAARAGGRPVFSAAQVTWNLLETSVAGAAAEAAAAGWAVLVKEGMANGRLAPGNAAGRDSASRDSASRDGPPTALAKAAAAAGTSTDALAIAAALAQPWATIVLSGVVTTGQLASNLGALALPGGAVADACDLGLAEPPAEYWARRSARPWA